MHAILFSIVLAAQVGRPDLVITAAGINADGHFTFTLMNRGDGGVGTPFKVDAWLDGYLRKTLPFETRGDLGAIARPLPTRLPVAPGERRNLTLTDVKVDLCSGNHAVKVVADSGGTISEASENNNELTWSGPTPCPDLAIKSITKHWQNSMHTEFTAEIVIINQGNGNAGPFGVAAGGTSITGIPSGAPMMYDGLRAGETVTLHAGNAYVPDGISVHVVVDIGNVIKESNENNNVADKSIH
ncbi:MAG TPA: CARDB domain-containing protein [Thermoanaerobaculia bacterium]|nr:CARDB domain-containing protein [Thermoanaerobaculia bacterium]